MLPSFALRPPGLCPVCHRWGRGGLCTGCSPRQPIGRARCSACALPLAPGLDRCDACRREPPAFEHARCAVDYGFPWDRLIGAFKFQHRIDLAPTLADRLADAVADDAPWAEVVIPVPLADARLAERGFNQAWELARRVARRHRRPARPAVLERPLDGRHQAGSSRAQRRDNLRHAFVVAGREAVAGRRVALVDDVLTTGATAEAAALALRRAGAAAVHLWVLARTP